MICLVFILCLVNISFAKEKIYSIYFPYDLNKTDFKMLPIYLPYSGSTIPNVDNVSIVANRKITQSLIQVFKKNNERYIKVVLQKQLGLTKVNEIKLNVNNQQIVYTLSDVRFEGFNNVRYDIIKTEGHTFDIEEVIFAYRNASSSKVKFLSFYCGNHLNGITMFDPTNEKWIPVKSKILLPGEEIRFKAKNIFYCSNFVYYIRPVVKFEYEGKIHTYFDIYIANYS